MKVNNTTVANLILSMFLMLYGSSIFWVGFHNNDMGHNMKWFECNYNTSLYDMGLDMSTGEPVFLTPTDGIITGSYQQLWGVIYMLGGMFVFGMSIGRIAPDHIKITIPTWSDIRGKDKRSRKKKKGKNKGKRK